MSDQIEGNVHYRLGLAIGLLAAGTSQCGCLGKLWTEEAVRLIESCRPKVVQPAESERKDD